jgi:hypothetical protein
MYKYHSCTTYLCIKLIILHCLIMAHFIYTLESKMWSRSNRSRWSKHESKILLIFLSEQCKPLCIPSIFFEFLFKSIVITISFFVHYVYRSCFDIIVALGLTFQIILHYPMFSCWLLANARHR